MDKNIQTLIQQSFHLSNPRFQVLSKERDRIYLCDEIGQTYYDVQYTDHVGGLVCDGVLGFGIDLVYDMHRGLTRHIGMLDTGHIVSDEFTFTSGDYSVTFIKSERLLCYEMGEDYSKEIGPVDRSRIIQCGTLSMVANPNMRYFDVCLKRGEDIVYTEHYAFHWKDRFECNTVEVKYENSQGIVQSGNHVDMTTASEGNGQFYRKTYMGRDGEPNYCSYFVSSVYDNLEGFGEWAPYQFSDVSDPYCYLIKNKSIQKEEILSYLSVIKWNPGHIRLTVYKLKDHFVIDISNQSRVISFSLPTIHSNSIDRDEILILVEYLETIIPEKEFLGIVRSELDTFAQSLKQGTESKEDVIDTFSIESLLHQEMDEIKELLSRTDGSIIEQLLKKKDSFDLYHLQEKVKGISNITL